MLEAAKDLGASEMTILRKIILPLAMPAVAAGWLLSFTLSMDDVVVSSFVTGPSYEILPLKIYSMVKVGVSPEVNALATILLVLSLVLVIASQVIARDKTKSQGHRNEKNARRCGTGALEWAPRTLMTAKTLYFYNWTEYVPPGLLEQFTKETGIKVIYSTYESNETMYAKLKPIKMARTTWWCRRPTLSTRCAKKA